MVNSTFFRRFALRGLEQKRRGSFRRHGSLLHQYLLTGEQEKPEGMDVSSEMKDLENPNIRELATVLG